MLKIPWKTLIVLVYLAGVGLPPQASADAADLVSLLSNDLGVTEKQAEGGAGAIFGYAKERMSSAEFSQLATAIPGLDGLLGAAPTGEPEGGAAGSLLSKGGALLGGSSSGLAQLGGSFAKLGMSPDMVSRFAPVILEYVNSAAGSELMSSLKNALM